MQNIINYFKDNPKFSLILIATLFICFIIITLIIIFYKKSKTINTNDLQKFEENIQNLPTLNKSEHTKEANFLKNSKNDEICSPEKDKSNNPSPSEVEDNICSNPTWIICYNNEKYCAYLKNNLNEILLNSEKYSTLSGVKSALESIKKNIYEENVAICLNENNQFIFKVFSASKKVLTTSKGYSTLTECQTALTFIKEFLKNAHISIEN